MQTRFSLAALAVAFLFALAPASAQTTEDETARPPGAAPSHQEPLSITGLRPPTSPLFVGQSQNGFGTTFPTYLIDPATDAATSPFDLGVAAAAYDPASDVVYMSVDGVEVPNNLYTWDVSSGTVSQVGQFNVSGTTFGVTSLAFQNGTLYGQSQGFAPVTEGLYSIDPTNGDATLLAAYSSGTLDCGGLDADPTGSVLYCTDDISASLRTLETNGTSTFVAAYPAGQVDIDGLAIGGGKAYLVTDEPGSIYVYDLGTNTYEAPLTNPFASAQTFSGAAWIGESGPNIDIGINTFTNDPERGESVFFRGPVTNNGTTTQDVYVYAIADIPGGQTYQRNLGRVTLAPGQTFKYKNFQNSKNYVPLPLNAPDGTYTVTVYAASDRFGTEVYDTDSFQFTLGPVVMPTVAAMPENGAASLEAVEPGAAPNPFRDATEIAYVLTEDAPVDLRVFDVTGREVASLVSGTQAAGTHSATLRAGDLPGGVYVWRLAIGGEVTTGRVTLSR